MNQYTGILPDNRSKKLKDKDYSLDEIAFGSSEYLTKTEADKSKKLLTIRDQAVTSQCVCFSTCSVLENTEGIVLSPVYLYTQRKNKPDPGCYYNDIGDIVVNQGVCREEILPTPTDEKSANTTQVTPEAREDAKKYKQKSYLVKENPTIDYIKDIVNSGDSLLASIFATGKEWGQEYPELINKKITIDTAPIRHAITILPNSAHTYKGKKYVIIQDSAHFGKVVFRYVSEDFIKARMRIIQNFTDLEYIEPQKWITPALYKGYKFTRDLTVGINGEDVNALQEILKVNGYFPNVKTTYYFGGLTRQAVKDFQKTYEASILWKVGLKLPTGYFGKSSISKINELLDNL